MPVVRSFMVSAPVFERLSFYGFSLYLVLRAVGTLTWSINLYIYEDYVKWKGIERSLETFIAISGILIIFALSVGVYSVLYFDNVKFRNGYGSSTSTALMFSVLFSVILIVQSVAAIYILIRISSVAGEFQEAFMNYGYRWEDKKFVDDIQRKWYCCGIYFSDDYETILNIAIPGSCCFKIGGTCSKWEISIFRPGCAFRLSAHGLFYSIYALSVFTLVFSVTEVFAFIFALHMMKSIKRRNEVKRQQTHVHSYVNNSNTIYPVYS